jgi:putative ABC transport system permease protein
MFFLKLVLRNAFRARLRTLLTIVGLVIALVAFGLLQAVVHAWYAGVDVASNARLVTRNAIALVFPLPSYYKESIRSIDGVTRVSSSNWFGGIWRDERSFFAQFAVDPEPFFAMYSEFVFTPDQWTDFLRDRRGAAIGRQLADLYGFKLGDRLPLRGTIYPGDHEFTVRAIYEGRDATAITRQMYFHWTYLDEFLKSRGRRGGVSGAFVVQVDDPDRAADISRTIDEKFRNSLAETLTETEKAFQLSFVAMVETIVTVITAVSYIVIAIIFAVAANTMAMTARERLAEYATLKALGFGPGFVARLIGAESVLIALIGAAIAMPLTPVIADAFYRSIGKGLFARFDVAPGTLSQQLIAALLVGVLAALLPMVRAARVKIVDGLRHVG